ncbi:hypothetical protein [Nocardia pseudovaccinii]|uniref:hypothetical protein n=1 Tax=Nocardia pseudovaccinii TaxID=189540 RepID=UPI0007A3EC5F|nr:hypothetical protein [Nocardia pseudovaccinii]
MTAPAWLFRSEWWQAIRAERRAEAEAKIWAASILRILELRETAVLEDVRARITTCTDLGQMTTWLESAVEAHTIDEFIA